MRTKIIWVIGYGLDDTSIALRQISEKVPGSRVYMPGRGMHVSHVTDEFRGIIWRGKTLNTSMEKLVGENPDEIYFVGQAQDVMEMIFYRSKCKKALFGFGIDCATGNLSTLESHHKLESQNYFLDNKDS